MDMAHNYLSERDNPPFSSAASVAGTVARASLFAIDALVSFSPCASYRFTSSS